MPTEFILWDHSYKELYNLSDDPGESNDLSDINSTKTDELTGKLKVWLKDQNAPVEFAINPAFDLDFELQKISEAQGDVRIP